MTGFPVFQIFSFLEAVLKFLATWIFLATFYAGWRVWKKRVAFQAELKCVHCKLSRSCSQTREQWWKHGGETSTCMWKDYGPGVLSFTSWKKCSSTFICFKSLVGNVETLMWRFLPFEIIWDFCLDEISMRKTMRFMRKNHPNWTIWFPKVRFTQNSLDGISYHFSTGMIIDYNYIVIYLYTFHDWNANSPDFVLGVDQHFLLHLSFLLKKTAGCLLLVAWLKTCCGVAFVAPPHDWLKEAGDLELEGKKARHFHRFSTCSWKGAISEDINVNVNQCYVDMVVFWVHKKCENSQLSIDSICFNTFNLCSFSFFRKKDTIPQLSWCNSRSPFTGSHRKIPSRMAMLQMPLRKNGVRWPQWEISVVLNGFFSQGGNHRWKNMQHAATETSGFFFFFEVRREGLPASPSCAWRS